MKRIFIAVYLIFLTVVTANAQLGSPDPGGSSAPIWQKKILSVNVVGTASTDTFLVLNSSGLVPGDILASGMVQDAIKGVFGLGLFSDVKIDANPEESGVRLIIIVEEFPKIRKLIFSGQRKSSERSLKK